MVKKIDTDMSKDKLLGLFVNHARIRHNTIIIEQPMEDAENLYDNILKFLGCDKDAEGEAQEPE